MKLDQKILSDVIIWSKYARYNNELSRREVWGEICDRYQNMMQSKYPQISEEIAEKMQFIREKKVLMSMRAAQFSGLAVELNNSRIYNCTFCHVDHYKAFSEVAFLTLGGSGCGYSVQKRHISKLPNIVKPTKTRKYVVQDDIIGWSDAVKVLLEAYFGINKSLPLFDFRSIRKKGTPLKTSGGKAPGHEPLETMLFKIRQILDSKEEGSKLSAFECHRIMCFIADAVLSGGIRRAALSCIFDADDEEMLYCKSGNYWELYPELSRSNNSAVLIRKSLTKAQWDKYWSIVKANKTGEPGFVFSNDPDMGFNPCFEISLLDAQCCNLTEINTSNIENEQDFIERCSAASFFGTLQAGFTDFHYLREKWRRVTESEALIGVGQTGIAAFNYSRELLEKGAEVVNNENERVAGIIGINKAARTTTVKPSGTTSLVLGCSSGIHAWNSEFYIRNIRISKVEPIYKYLVETVPNLIEDSKEKPNLEAVLSVPQQAPEGSIVKIEETALSLLERAKDYQLSWVRPGHRQGNNYNNVSITVNLKETEWDSVGVWIWDNKDYFSAISVLPEDLGTYVQAPYIEITKEKYEHMQQFLSSLDLTRVKEYEDNTDLTGEASCAGGLCEIK
jgi:ribonucleoside-diphosphate reductase alpha chain